MYSKLIVLVYVHVLKEWLCFCNLQILKSQMKMSSTPFLPVAADCSSEIFLISIQEPQPFNKHQYKSDVSRDPCHLDLFTFSAAKGLTSKSNMAKSNMHLHFVQHYAEKKLTFVVLSNEWIVIAQGILRLKHTCITHMLELCAGL